MKKEKDTQEQIRNDLIAQLEAQNKFEKFYSDLIDDYVYLYKVKEMLKDDIDNAGVNVVWETGNGYSKTADNKSIDKLLKVNTQMLKILSELKLSKPITEGSDPDDLL